MSKSSLFSFGLLMLSFVLSFRPAFANAEETRLWNLKFAGPNLCARQSKEPASSVMIYFDGFSSGRAAQRWAKHLKQKPESIMSQVWADFHKRSFLISRAVLDGLASGTLPLLNERDFKHCAGQNCESLNLKISNAINRLIYAQKPAPKSQVSCVWIRKSLPQQLKLKAPNRQELEQIALAYLDKSDYIERCEDLLHLRGSGKADLVLRYHIKNFQNWRDTGFDFWTSFKYYYSKAWSSSWNMPQVRYQDLLKSFAADEIVTMIAEGCYSISNPECSTDFLSQNQLNQTLAAGNFSDTFLMAQEMVKKEGHNLFNQLSSQDPSAETIETRQMLMSSMKVRHQASKSLLDSVKKLNAILAQFSPDSLVKSAQEQLSSPDQEPLAETLCAEIKKFGDKETSGFALEMANAKALIARLESLGLPGDDVRTLWSQVRVIADTLRPYCHEVERRLQAKMASGQIEYTQLPARDWVNVVTQYSLPLEVSQQGLLIQNADRSMVKLGSEIICSDAADCVRTLIESAVEVYHVALYQQAVLPNSVREQLTKGHMGSTVACKLFDPWAASQARKKKFIYDVMSSFLSGITRLPIYLDVNVPAPIVTSFKQLVDDGRIVFDPVMKESGLNLSLLMDLGVLAKSPCLIHISNHANVTLPNSVYAFRGIEVKYCSTRTRGEAQADVMGNTQVKTQSMSGCGSCSINFDQALMSTIRSEFTEMRFGLRLLGAFINYFKSAEDLIANPIEFEVNPQYAAEAYKKYNEIPDKCVYELTRGSKCMEDLCVSKTVVEFENQTGFKVENASMWTDVDIPTSRSVWVKVAGCAQEYGIPVVCEPNRAPMRINIDPYLKKLSCAQR